MERVAFLIEATGERISCMLNPESLVVRRAAGVRRQESLNGEVTGLGLSDDPLRYTGGGTTTLQFDLLFDIHLSGSSLKTSDVRDLTRPLWQLAENSQERDLYGAPPLVRFVWGKAWNLLGVITAVAERFDRFSPAGDPQRSWLRMRFVRVNEPEPTSEMLNLETQQIAEAMQNLPEDIDLLSDPTLLSGYATISDYATISGYATIPGAAESGASPLPEMAYKLWGNPALWRLLARFNAVLNPLRMEAGTVIRIPSLAILGRFL